MNGYEGYILLHRSLLESFAFVDPYHLKLWMYCLMRAAYQTERVHIGKHTLMLRPGEFVWGRQQAAQVLNHGLRRSERRTAVTWERKLKALEEHEMIRRETTNHYTLIFVRNFEYYQRGIFGKAFEQAQAPDEKPVLGKNVYSTCSADVQQTVADAFSDPAAGFLGAQGDGVGTADFVNSACSASLEEISQNLCTNNEGINKQKGLKDLKERGRREPEITTRAPAREEFSGDFGERQGQGREQRQGQRQVQDQDQVQGQDQDQVQERRQNRAQGWNQVKDQNQAQVYDQFQEPHPIYPDLLTQYRKAFSQPVTEIITQSINAWANDFGAELVSYALELSGKNQAKSLRYVERILKNWQNEGVQRLADARAQTAAFELMREGARKERLEHQRFAQENQRLPTAELPKVSLHNWLKN